MTWNREQSFTALDGDGCRAMANTRVEEVKEILCCNVAIAILQTIFTRYSSFSLTSCRTWKVQTPENRNPTGADCPCQAMVRETQGLEMKPPSPVNGGASYRERPTSLSMLRAGWFAGGALAGIVVTLMASGAPPTFPGSHRRALQGQEQQLQTSPRCVLESLLGVTPEMESNIESDIIKRNVSLTALVPLFPMPGGKSVLQDVFVRMQSIMEELGMLPMAGFGIGRCSRSNPVPCGWRQREQLLDRKIMVRFFEAHAHLVPAGASCMEWDSVYYLNLLKQPVTRRPACHQSWALKYQRAKAPLTVNPQHRHVYGDLQALVPMTGTSLLGNMSGFFDFIICNQVFEHVGQPFAAAKGLFGLMKPGGVVLFTVRGRRDPFLCTFRPRGDLHRFCEQVPFVAIFHRVPVDHFRYTLDGASKVFESAGFEVLQRWKLGAGTHLSIGYLLGFGTADYDADYVSKRSMMTEENASKVPGGNVLWLNSALVLRRPAE